MLVNFFHTSLNQFFLWSWHNSSVVMSTHFTTKWCGKAYIETSIERYSCTFVPKPYRSDVVLTACYLINCMSSTVLGGQIPHVVLSPDTLMFHLPLKIFGCDCYVHALGPRGDKLDPKSTKCFSLSILILRENTKVIPLLFNIILLVLMLQSLSPFSIFLPILILLIILLLAFLNWSILLHHPLLQGNL